MGAIGLAEISGNADRHAEAVDALRTVLRSAPPDTAPDDLFELTLQLAWWTGQSGASTDPGAVHSAKQSGAGTTSERS
jgi:hypothetical protein